MNATKKRSRVAIALAAAFAIAATLMTPIAAGAATVPPGTAKTRMAGTYLESGSQQASTDFFVYLNAGEQLRADFSATGWSADGSRVDVTNQKRAVVYDRTIPKGGSGYGGSWTATESGVWRVRVFDAPNGDHARLDWSIAALNSSGSSIPGRVWSESIAFFTSTETDISLFTLNEEGSEYRVDMQGYFGIDSTIAMNNIGNSLRGKCEPAFVSVPEGGSAESGGAAYWQPRVAGDCSQLAPYRMFLDRPDQTMPLSSTRWADGRTTDRWLHQAYQDPALSLTSYNRTAQTSQAGVLRGRLDGQPGEVAIKIDVDGDTKYNGSKDVTSSITVGRTGAFSFNWDGRDKQGNPVSVSKIVNFRAEMAKVAPIHFLRIDAEASGGLKMTALEGPSGGSSTMYWDDGPLVATSGSRFSGTPITDGSAGFDSSSFRHGWARDDSGANRNPNANDGVTGSHGDMRSIDDWTFQSTNAFSEIGTAAVSSTIDIRKTINGNDANTSPGVKLATGATMRIDFEVTGGPQALTGVRVTDDVYGAITCPRTTLAPLASMTCTINRPAPAPGVQHRNTGTVVATDEAGGTLTASDFAHAHVDVVHGLRVDKSPARLTTLADGRISAVWDVTVSNAGNVAATGVVLTDWASNGHSWKASKRTANGTDPAKLTSPTAFANADPTSTKAQTGGSTQRTYAIGTLQPGTSAQLRVTATYWPQVNAESFPVNMAWAASAQQARTAPAALPKVTAANYAAAGVSVAGCTAVGHDGDRCDTTPARIAAGKPILTIDKTAPTKSSRVHGESVTWSYTVRNTGTVQASGVTVKDDRVATIKAPTTAKAADGTTRAWNGILRPGESAVFTATGPIYRTT